MANQELSTDRDSLLNTTPSSIRAATFFLRPFYLVEAGANFFGGTMSPHISRDYLYHH
jgi:hypothetical protein